MNERLHSYPKVYAIGHSAVSELFHGEVLVEEKIDGSQFSFSRTGDSILMRSRGAVVYPETAGMFSAAVQSVKEMAPTLNDGWVYRCEYLYKPKHNVLAYSRIPHRCLILFDINTGEEVYLDRYAKEQEAERIGLEIVPLLHRGPVAAPDKLYALLERESVLGGKKVEGIVVKNYARFGVDKKVLMGKYVSEDFKETHSKEWKAANPTVSDVVERLIATLRSERRWEKAAERLRDAGTLENSPRDIGMLLKEVQSDIRAEELPFIQSKLLEWALPRILRASGHGLPEWYKKRLLESAFSPASETTEEVKP
jgi:ATP-dependent RNA circularization protein (DNA/RNA ligase family)